jgi:transposase
MHDRHELTDAEWALLEPLVADRSPRRGGQWGDHRRMINGVLWRTCTGAPWRDLPAAYGKWQTVYHRHRRWSADGTWEHVWDRLRAGCDGDHGRAWIVGIDSSVVRAHHDAAGARNRPPIDVPAGRMVGVLKDATATSVHTGGAVE